jgi:hypothetical protein
MLRPSYFLSDLHRGLRASCETFAEKPNDAPSSLSVIKKEASALLVGDTLGKQSLRRSPTPTGSAKIVSDAFPVLHRWHLLLIIQNRLRRSFVQFELCAHCLQARWGCSNEIDSTGRVIFKAEAYARDGCRFIILADDRLAAFLELDAAIHHQRNPSENRIKPNCGILPGLLKTRRCFQWRRWEVRQGCH